MHERFDPYSHELQNEGNSRIGFDGFQSRFSELNGPIGFELLKVLELRGLHRFKNLQHVLLKVLTFNSG
jgi:hypothetical protein